MSTPRFPTADERRHHGLRQTAAAAGAVATLVCGLSCLNASPDADSPHNASEARAFELGDFERCPEDRISYGGLWEFWCLFPRDAEPIVAAPLADADPPAAQFREYVVELTEVDGQYEGAITLPPGHGGEAIVALGTPNVPFDITADGVSVPVNCSSYAPDECPRFRGYYFVSLEPGVRHRMEFGPIFPQRYIRLLLMSGRSPGGTMSDTETRCDANALGSLGFACADGLATTPINAAPIGQPWSELPVITAGIPYGVHLQSVGPAFEGSVRFNALDDALYTLYLGTPNIPLRAVTPDLTGEGTWGEEERARCSRSVSDDLARSLTGDTCSPFRGAYQFRGFEGLEMKFDLGPASPQKWVRMMVVASDMTDDRDGDGTPDERDGCPDSPEANADYDRDGVCPPEDPCQRDPQDDVDGDGLCSNEDNCASVPNPDQTDADGDRRGDACDACPLDPNNDRDRDGLCGDVDPCPRDAENDADGDGVCETDDNCPAQANPDQVDTDGDGLGDRCDPCPDCRITIATLNERQPGNMQRLSGANRRCAEAATAAGLDGTWQAFLSDASQDVADLFPTDAGPVVNLEGETVVRHWPEMPHTRLRAPVHTFDLRDPDDVISQSRAWTGSDEDGNVGAACLEWRTTRGSERGTTRVLRPWWRRDLFDAGCDSLNWVMCVSRQEPVAPAAPAAR
ncbi:MAG: hypothetical protein B7733_22995 [Myxococcales bacterium FL481]|nr:MAG: hypothetical protein B7733_22995 [Myxococcales bacterium FL481]